MNKSHEFSLSNNEAPMIYSSVKKANEGIAEIGSKIDKLLENDKISKDICINIDLLPKDDPVQILINESDGKTVSGDYEGGLSVAQQALKVAEEFDKNDSMFTLRIACAKLKCVLSMRLFPEHCTTAIEYIADIMRTGVFENCPKKMFSLHSSLAVLSILNNDLSVARAAVINARTCVNDDDDTIACDEIESGIAVKEGRYDDAIYSYKKIADTLSLKAKTKAYKDDEDCYVIEQNLSTTLNNIAIAYRNKGNLQQALIYVKQAVESANSESLSYERAVFLGHWADMLFDESFYDIALEKAMEARELFMRKNKKGHLAHICKVIGASAYRLNNLTLSYEINREALAVADDPRDKFHFHRCVAHLAAELGDKQTLDEQIDVIRELEAFDDNNTDRFVDWINRLQITCKNVLPEKFKNQPDAHFIFDEYDDDFKRLKKSFLDYVGDTQTVSERNEKVKDFLMQLSNKASESNKAKPKKRPETELKKLIAKMNNSGDLREKAQLMYEIAIWHYDRHDEDEADLWLLRAMNSEGASSHTVMWSKITHAQVLMNKRFSSNDEEAKNILDDVAITLNTSKNHEAIAFCQYHRGRLEARIGNFENALSLLKQSYKAASEGYFNTKTELLKDIRHCISRVNHHIEFNKNNPIKDLHTLQQEYLFFQTWYPEYRQQLSEYWWHYRASDVLSNIQISRKSACAIFSDDKDKICWYSEALRPLFAHCLFAPKEHWINNEHAYIQTVPVPCDTPFPYTISKVNDEKVNGKVYGYNFAIDGSERRYAYTRLEDEVTFDKNREPKPITLSYLGYRKPKIVTEISPMTDEFGSCRWWIGALYEGSPVCLLNLVLRFGVIPVFHIDDVKNSKEIIIVASERIDIPFNIDISKVKNIQKELRRMTSISEEEILVDAYDTLIENIASLSSNINTSLVSVNLAVLRFDYRIWDESPTRWRAYPAVIITPEDEWKNSKIDDVISKSVTVRDAIYLTSRINGYTNHPHSTKIKYLIDDNEQLLGLAEQLENEAIFKETKALLENLYRHLSENGNNIDMEMMFLRNDEQAANVGI